MSKQSNIGHTEKNMDAEMLALVNYLHHQQDAGRLRLVLGHLLFLFQEVVGGE